VLCVLRTHVGYTERLPRARFVEGRLIRPPLPEGRWRPGNRPQPQRRHCPDATLFYPQLRVRTCQAKLTSGSLAMASTSSAAPITVTGCRTNPRTAKCARSEEHTSELQ